MNPWEMSWGQEQAPWERDWSRKTSEPVTYDAAKETGAGEAALVAAGRWLDRKAAGLREKTPEPVRNAVDWVGEKLGMAPPPTDNPDNERAYAALQKERPVATFAGDAAANLATLNPVAMGVAATLDPGTWAERGMRGAAAFGAGKAGEYLGGKLAPLLSKRAEQATVKAAEQNAMNAPRNATIAAAREAGYVIPPVQTNPTMLNRAAEGLAGKISTAQAAAVKNQQVTNSLARAEVQLAPDAPITPHALEQVRSTAGKAYEAVRNAGTIPLGEDFVKEFGSGLGPYLQLKGELPSQSIAKVDQLIQDLTRENMQAGTIVDLVKRLRFDGFKNVKAPDPETAMLGRAQLSAMNALENAMDRHLTSIGQDAAVANLQQARTLIAKTHAIEDALNASTGDVVAGKIGRRFTSGKPLSGNLETIGRTAEAFPKAVQNVNSSMPGVSPLDFYAAAGGASLGHPSMLAGLFARPAVRAAILSEPWQKHLGMATAAPSVADRAAGMLGAHPYLTKRLGAQAGLLGLLSTR